MQPRLTVVIPCHNHGRWVWEAIESVALQTYENKTIVVVDDGSTDGSFEEVCRGLYKAQSGRATGLNGEPEFVMGTIPNNDTKLVILRYPEAHGPSFARNRGIEVGLTSEEFGGDIFGILDADDVWRPNRAKRCIEKFVQYPEVGLVYTDYDTVNEQTGVAIREFKEPFNRARLLRDCIVTNACFIRKEAFEQVGGYDEQMRVAEDYDLFLRISERFMVWHIPESLVYIRVGGHNTTFTVPTEVWQANWKRCADKLRERSRV